MGGKCGLRHVLRAEKGKGSVEEAKADGLESDQAAGVGVRGKGKMPVEGGFEEQDEFIEFDHGTPADPESESEEEGISGSASGSGSAESEEVEEDGDEDEAADEDDEDEDSDDESGSDTTEQEKQVSGKPSSPQISSVPPHPQSNDLMDTDEVDEDEVLDVVL